MKRLEISDNIHMISLNVEDILFEGIWDIANGVTLNSYIVKGEKTAIVDGVIGWEGVAEDLYKTLEEINVKPEDIDYLIVNHMEPDHSGWIENLKKINKDFTIIGTSKAADLVRSFFGDTENIRVVKEGDTLDLGKGKILSFHPAPNIHWPDTMLTYEESTKTLFSCDMYGSFGKIENTYFDDEMDEEDIEYFENEGIRYFSNVMTTFSPQVVKAIEKTRKLDINIVAPGHGPLYRKNPEKIINDYERFAKYAKGAGKKEVTILWGSMYGMTKKAIDFAVKILERENIKVNSLEMPIKSDSEMVSTVFKSAGIIVAAPTYEYKMFPPVAAALDELGRKKISSKAAFSFGSYGWSGGAQKELSDIMERNRMKWDFVEPVEFEGAPKEEDFKKIEEGIIKLLEKMEDKII